jgi:membrane protein YdbS with pleckstrin-like domain
MTRHVDSFARQVYVRTWEILTNVFRVPREPPTLPATVGESIETFRPADGFLRYLKFQFWLGLLVIDLLILFGWIAVAIASPLAGVVLFVPALVIAVVPDIIAYVAIHLRYDTTWYVVSPRSLRLRRGIWVIHETTITFENIQNVSVRQGPLQRWFGIADVLVETAGGGDSSQPQSGLSLTHRGLIEGVADAQRIRDLLLARLRQSRDAGLGDESSAAAVKNSWTTEQVEALRAIRDAVRRLPTSG